jgi:hypothetical protein
MCIYMEFDIPPIRLVSFLLPPPPSPNHGSCVRLKEKKPGASIGISHV